MQLRTEIEIDAPSQAVWATLTDFHSYPEWNPFITGISGKLALGEELTVNLSLPEGSDYTLRPKLIRYEPEREFCWLGHLWFKGLFDGEHFFRLRELAEGRTRVTHGENFSGVLLRLLGPTLTKTSRGFVYMNQALKRRVEGQLVR
ncbi:MAG TPA: SRPBCC domain-containing protein [Polyangiaceae bacterium]